MGDSSLQHLSGWGWLCVFALVLVAGAVILLVARMLPDSVLILVLVACGLFALLKHLMNPRKP